MQLQYEVSKKDFEVVFYNILKKTKSRGVGCLAYFLILMLFMSVLLIPFPADNFTFLPPLLLAALIIFIFVRNSKRMKAKRLLKGKIKSGELDPQYFGSHTLEASEDRLILRYGAIQGERLYGGIREVRACGGVIAVFTDGDVFDPIPDSAFASPEERDSFFNLLQSKVSEAAPPDGRNIATPAPVVVSKPVVVFLLVFVILIFAVMTLMMNQTKQYDLPADSESAVPAVLPLLMNPDCPVGLDWTTVSLHLGETKAYDNTIYGYYDLYNESDEPCTARVAILSVSDSDRLDFAKPWVKLDDEKINEMATYYIPLDFEALVEDSVADAIKRLRNNTDLSKYSECIDKLVLVVSVLEIPFEPYGYHNIVTDQKIWRGYDKTLSPREVEYSYSILTEPLKSWSYTDGINLRLNAADGLLRMDGVPMEKGEKWDYTTYPDSMPEDDWSFRMYYKWPPAIPLMSIILSFIFVIVVVISVLWQMRKLQKGKYRR